MGRRPWFAWGTLLNVRGYSPTRWFTAGNRASVLVVKNKDARAGKPPLVVEKNIRALLNHRDEELRNRDLPTRVSDSVTRFAGSMRFVALHAALFGVWVFWNLEFVPLPKFDPTYVVLAMFASVEAIFLSTFVLISQNRMTELAERRAELDLQMSLLIEHEVTRLAEVIDRIAGKLSVATPADIQELKQEVRPEAVLESLKEAELKTAAAPSTGKKGAQ